MKQKQKDESCQLSPVIGGGGEGEREVCVACNLRNLSRDGDVLYLDYISVSILPVIL